MRHPPRPYQLSGDAQLRENFRRGLRAQLLVQPTGTGKCLGRGTPVLLHDGRIVPVEDVRVGDTLMGPDSEPRRVTSTTQGHGPLYRVTPTKGDPWICNDAHILTLVHTEHGTTHDVPLQQWLAASKWFRHCHKQFMVGVDYGPSDPLPIDPYFFGLWLGDGNKHVESRGLTTVGVTKPDREVLQCMQETASTWGLRVVTSTSGGTRCPTHHLSRAESSGPNRLLTILRDLVGPRVEVPRSYLVASRQDRLRMLAGWLDADGHLGTGCFEIAQKREDHAHALMQLARSLGFRATNAVKIIGGELYQRMMLSGDFSVVPTRIERKKASPRLQIKDARRTGFTVAPIGEGDFFGFTLDRDGRFLLGDFTVTHNTVAAAMVIEGALAKGNEVLFLAHRKELIQQCSKTLDEIGIDHGIIKGKRHWRTRPDAPVQVASVQTLVRRKLPKARVVILDEAHRALNDTNTTILAGFPDALVLGLTATPWRLDGRGLGGIFQSIVAPITYREAIAQGYLLQPRIYEPDRPNLKGVPKSHGDFDKRALERRLREDPKRVGNLVENWLEFGEGQRTLVFATSVEDSNDIVRRFKDAGVRAEHLDGDTNETLRDEVLARLESGETQLVSNVDVLVEGYDLPSLGCVTLARPTMSLTRFLQSIGRGARPYAGQQYFIVLDHAGCCARLGDPTADQQWSLEDRKPKRETEDPAEMLTCPECMLMRPANVFHCPQCSAKKTGSPWQASMFGGLPVESDGRLVERAPPQPLGHRCASCRSESVQLEPYNDLRLRVVCRSCGSTSYQADPIATRHASAERRAAELARLEQVREQKGFKPGWVTAAYRETFGEPPPRK